MPDTDPTPQPQPEPAGASASRPESSPARAPAGSVRAEAYTALPRPPRRPRWPAWAAAAIVVSLGLFFAARRGAARHPAAAPTAAEIGK